MPLNKEDMQKYNREYKKTHRGAINALKRKSDAKFRVEALTHYGGKCACCGESKLEFLCLDHINGGGNEDRRQHGLGTSFYRWLRTNGYPDGFRVLCYNCNMALGMYGSCPHASVAQ